MSGEQAGEQAGEGVRARADSASSRPVAVVTGASGGIGLAAAEALAQRGWSVALAGRDPVRLEAAGERVRSRSNGPVETFPADFADLDQVRSLAARLRAHYPRIDVLANNAGGILHRHSRSADGHELTIQVNHLAGFLLSVELRDRLAGGRIINTASAVHKQGRLDPGNLNGDGHRYVALRAYASAKQASIAFVAEAARRWPEILSVAFHPGVVRTQFGRGNPVFRFFFRYSPGLRTPEEGADTLVWLATAPAAQLRRGGYYCDRRVQQPAARCVDPEFTARVWAASSAAVGLGG